MSPRQDSEYIRTPNTSSNLSDHVNVNVGTNPMGLGIQDINGDNYFNAQRIQSQRPLETTTEQGPISPQSIPFSPTARHSCQQSFTTEHPATGPNITSESARSIRTIRTSSAHSTCSPSFGAATSCRHSTEQRIQPTSQLIALNTGDELLSKNGEIGRWNELCWGDATDADMKLLRGPVQVVKVDKRLIITGCDDNKGEKLKIIGECASCLNCRMLISYSRPS